MSKVTAADVKKLRQMTNCGFLDCKNALIEADNNFEDAVTILRKKAGAKADKKADRAANEGLTASVIDGSNGALVQLACETDFVAKTDRFIEFVQNLANETLALSGDGDQTEALAEGQKDILRDLIGSIGENMKIVKAVRWESAGKIGSYLHAGGKIGVLVDVEGDCDDALLKDICMHIAAMNPTYVTPDDIPADVTAKERDIVAEKAKGKPENIVEKIVTGGLNKWHTDICLMKQSWFKDDKTTLAKLAPNITVKRFVRLQAGG